MPEKNPWTLQSLGSYLGWANNQSDEQIWRFAAERERVLRVAQAMLETKKSDAPTAEAAIRDRITALRAPAPQEPT